MVYCAGLENRRAERPRGFESYSLRHFLHYSQAIRNALPSAAKRCLCGAGFEHPKNVREFINVASE